MRNGNIKNLSVNIRSDELWLKKLFGEALLSLKNKLDNVRSEYGEVEKMLQKSQNKKMKWMMFGMNPIMTKFLIKNALNTTIVYLLTRIEILGYQVSFLRILKRIFRTTNSLKWRHEVDTKNIEYFWLITEKNHVMVLNPVEMV